MSSPDPAGAPERPGSGPTDFGLPGDAELVADVALASIAPTPAAPASEPASAVEPAPAAEPHGRRRPSLFIRPKPGSSPDTVHNWAATQREAIWFGELEAAYAFVAILLVRLGATNLQIGLLSALAPLATFVMAVPFGSFVQRRRNAVPWYARGRALGQMVIPLVGVVVLLAPEDLIIPLTLIVAAVCAFLQSFADLVFWVVMDGVAGPGGRYSLIGHRLGVKMGVNAGSQATIGAFLSRAPFPIGYAAVFLTSGISVLLGYRWSRTLRIPDNPPPPPATTGVPSVSVRHRVAGLLREVGGERRFAAFTSMHTLFTFGVRMALPLLPLWYVRELDASDAFIGIVGTVMAAATMVGYFVWRRPARRFGGTRVLVPSTIGVAAYPILLTFAHTDALVLVFVAISAFCTAGMDLAVFDALMNTVPADRSVRFAALDTGAVNFSGVVAPLVGAALASAVGLAPALVAAGFVGLLGAIGLPLAVGGRRPRGRRWSLGRTG
ncbi:MAG: MFS transporter [Chloroflexota bacterium]